MNEEEEKKFCIEIYNKFRNKELCLRQDKNKFSDLKYVPYEKIECTGVDDLYEKSCNNFLVSLANEINKFKNYIIKIEVWNLIIEEKLNKEEGMIYWDKYYILSSEFINPILNLLLNYPYFMKSRFLFVAIHLCYQANSLSLKEYKEKLPEKYDIKEKNLEKYGNNWSGFEEFKKSIENLSINKFISEYRNSFHHRNPVNLNIGLSFNIISKEYMLSLMNDINIPDDFIEQFKKNSPEINYIFNDPIKIGDVLTPIKVEYQNCYSTFIELTQFIKKQVAQILSSLK